MSQGEQKPRTNPESRPTEPPRELADEQLDAVVGGAEQLQKSTSEQRVKQIT